MKISEIRTVVNEDMTDAIKSGLYKATGGGLFGQTGQQAALKGNYIKKFANQLALNIKSAKSAGVGPFDLDDYLKSYAAQYGWNLTPKEIENLTTLANTKPISLNKIANYMYILADKYRETRRQGGAPEPTAPTAKKKTTPKATDPTDTTDPTTPGNNGPTGPTAPSGGAGGAPSPKPGIGYTRNPALGNTKTTPQPTAPSEDASTSAEKVMAALGQIYKMPTAAVDLDKILRDVAYLLSRKDAARYAHVIKDLTSGIGGVSAAGTKGTDYPGDQTTQPKSSTPKSAEQAMPGYNKAAADLSSKMKSNLPRDPTITKAYRPGSRPQAISDVEPKESKKFKRK